MSSLTARSVSRTAVATVNRAARLELLEYFLAHTEDLVLCVETGLEWLATRRGICSC